MQYEKYDNDKEGKKINIKIKRLLYINVNMHLHTIIDKMFETNPSFHVK